MSALTLAALLAVACLLTGEFNRRGQTRRILLAVGLAFMVEVVDVALKDLATRAWFAIPLLYANLLIPLLICALDAVARKRAALAPPRICGTAGGVAGPMSPWKTLFRYIARQFFTWCTIIFLSMMSIVFLLDYIELIRRAGTRPDATLLVLLEMAALKQPDMMQQIMPFAILFGTMMAFWRLTRSHELVVARAAGISAWQFLAPPLSGAFLVGVLMVTVFNPIASVMQAAYEQLDNRILRGGGDQLSLSRGGFWLRQSDEAGNHSIVHAKGFAVNRRALDDVMILFLAGDTKLARRIDAQQALLRNGVWEVHDGTEWEPGKPLTAVQPRWTSTPI